MTEHLFPAVRELPSAPGGFTHAWDRGNRRRRRVVRGLAGGGALGVAAALALTLSLGGSVSGSQVLVPGGPTPGSSATVEPTATQGPAGGPTTAPQSSVRQSSSDAAASSGPLRPQATLLPGGPATGSVAAGSTGAHPSSGPMERRYYGRRSNDGHTAVDGQQVCGGLAGRASGTRQEWCGESSAARDGAGVRLEVDITPQTDNTQGLLTFDTEREADFAVYNNVGRLVWRWSAQVRPPRTAAHELTCEAVSTYLWGTTWDRRGAKGVLVASGDYVLRAVVAARQLGTTHVFQTAFTVG